VNFIAIDPGTTESAYVVFEDGMLAEHDIVPNDDLLVLLLDEYMQGYGTVDTLVVEYFECHGNPVGKESIRTIWWTGRFKETWRGAYFELTRNQVKMHLCQSPRAGDPNVTQALVDMYGGTMQKAKGTIKQPGPLFGVRADIWQALAVGVTYLALQKERAAHP